MAEEDRGQPGAAGHAGRANPRRRLRPRRGADADRRRHDRRRRQAADRNRRQAIPARDGAALAIRAGACVPGRLSRQSLLRPHRAKLQSGHGHGGRHRHRHRRAYRSGRGDRARPRRDPRPRSSTTSSPTGEAHGPPDHHREARRAGASAGKPGQSRHRHSDPGRELRAARAQCVLPVGERPDRHRTDSRARHGASVADRCRRPADQRASGRIDLRQRDVVRPDPRRPCRCHRARRTAGRRRAAISPTG